MNKCQIFKIRFCIFEKKIWDGLFWNLIGWNNFQKEPYHSQLFADIALFAYNYVQIVTLTDFLLVHLNLRHDKGFQMVPF